LQNLLSKIYSFVEVD